MHAMGPAILPVAILSVVGILTVALATIEGLARAALSQCTQQNGVDDDVEHTKVGYERQSRAPTAAGGEEEEEGKDCVKIGGSITLQRPRMSFVTDKALDGSVGRTNGYHQILSTSWGMGDHALTRASAALKDGREGPAPGGALSGASSWAGDGQVTVRVTYGTMSGHEERRS